jgi:hypothetical protein
MCRETPKIVNKKKFVHGMENISPFNVSQYSIILEVKLHAIFNLIKFDA